VIDRPITKKRYEQDDVDYSTYMNIPERTIFLAHVGEKVAGQIILRKNWNKYAYVEGIVVDLGFRRLGIDQALISQAKRWALERQFPGIMLETQNNNVRACKFYEACGSKISGFDNNLYKGIDAKTDEVALYWYFHFN
jgi:ribosomal protein S18 acetylase RimI-like enzyme